MIYILLRSIARKFFALIGLGFLSKDKAQLLEVTRLNYDNLIQKLPFVLFIKDQAWSSNIAITNLLTNSKSQNGQDFFALIASGGKSSGVFLEFGAYNGIDLSNTYMLERNFNWTGLLVEPIPENFQLIQENRTCQALSAAVSPRTMDEITMFQAAAPDLSKVIDKSGKEIDFWSRGQKRKTLGYSLNDLMEKFLKMSVIDFLSVDTEGGELEILEALDFSKFSFMSICVEHNYSEQRYALRSLLEENGYLLVFQEFSGNDFWFIHKDNENLRLLSTYVS